MRSIWRSLSLIACLACGSETNNQGNAVTPVPDSSLVNALEKPEDALTHSIDSVPANIQIDTVIQLVINQGQDMIRAKGSINKKSSPVICRLQVQEPHRIKAQLISQSPGLQVRFSEIIFPDKHVEGPFGQKIEHNLSTPGLYQFIITPHSMSGSNKSGDFVIEVKRKF